MKRGGVRVSRRITMGVGFLLVTGAAVSAPGGDPDPRPGKDGPDAVPLVNLPEREAIPFSSLSNWPPAETNPPADVVHYDLDLTFDLATASISGTAPCGAESEVPSGARVALWFQAK